MATLEKKEQEHSLHRLQTAMLDNGTVKGLRNWGDLSLMRGRPAKKLNLGGKRREKAESSN